MEGRDQTSYRLIFRGENGAGAGGDGGGIVGRDGGRGRAPGV